jgi:peptidoglycan/xylan/chitin deacetylase (PgdA/CDA1 family)
VYGWDDKRIITNLSHLGVDSNKRVVLTFDDGPNEYTKAIIEILNKQNIRANFFWLSSQIHSQSLVHEVVKDGHTIGLHGYRHLPFHQFTPAIQKREMLKGLEQLQNYAGAELNINFFRPPYGRYNDATLEILNELNMRPILWDVASLDWELDDEPDQIIANVTNNIQDGSIILLHELPQTVKILEDLIIKIRKLGFGFSVL